MVRWRIALLLAVSLIICSCAADPGSHGVTAWFVDSLVKVFPSDAANTHRLDSAGFEAARNQHVNIQLAVRSDHEINGISARLEEPDDGNGHAISDFSVRRVGDVVVGSHTQNTPPDELVGTAPGWFPDPLFPLPLDLKADQTQSVWVEIHVPENAAPGTYHGAVDLSSGRDALAQLPFSLKVVTARVPEQRSLHVTNWFTLDDKTSKQFFNAPAFSDQWWKLVSNVARVLATHRQNVVFTPLMELIQGRNVNGRLAYDFSNFDRWVETFKAAGAIGYIEGSHILTRPFYTAPLGVQVFRIEGGKVVTETVPADSPEVERFLSNFLPALNRHLEQKHWKSIYFQHVLDEAHGNEVPYYGKVAKLVHRYLPGVPTLDAVNAQKMPEIIQDNCDIWSPLLGRFDDAMDLLNHRVQSGHQVWYYTCLYPQGQYLNRFIDFPLIKTRLLPWFDFRHGFTGFLHWGGNYWTPNPILDTQPVINDNTELLPPGDAFIYYPNRKGLTFYSSIRMEQFLAGIEDYELLHALQSKNPQEAERLGKQAISSFTDYVRKPSEFRKIETQLLQEDSGS